MRVGTKLSQALTLFKGGKEVQILTGQKLIEKKIIPLVPEMIGSANAVTQSYLVQKCFGHGFTDLQHMMLRQILHGALTHLRQNDEYRCFIMGRWDERDYAYFVPTTQDDVDYFKKLGQAKIDGIKASMERCERSVKERWFDDLKN